MPTPSMPLQLVKGKITKDVRNMRENAEKALITGESIKESPQVKANPIAHQHFLRLVKLYKAIQKNDALIENIINRYCIMQAECADYETEQRRLENMAADLEDHKGDMEYEKYIRAAIEITKAMGTNQSRLNTIRKMLFDIERESIMTLAAQMRSIPKKMPEENNQESGVASFKRRRSQ